MIFHVDLDLKLNTGSKARFYLLAAFVVRDSKAISNFDFCAIVAAYSQHCANHSFLVRASSQGMVKNGEENNGLDGGSQR